MCVGPRALLWLIDTSLSLLFFVSFIIGAIWQNFACLFLTFLRRVIIIWKFVVLSLKMPWHRASLFHYFRRIFLQSVWQKNTKTNYSQSRIWLIVTKSFISACTAQLINYNRLIVIFNCSKFFWKISDKLFPIYSFRAINKTQLKTYPNIPNVCILLFFFSINLDF